MRSGGPSAASSSTSPAAPTSCAAAAGIGAIVGDEFYWGMAAKARQAFGAPPRAQGQGRPLPAVACRALRPPGRRR